MRQGGGADTNIIGLTLTQDNKYFIDIKSHCEREQLIRLLEKRFSTFKKWRSVWGSVHDGELKH